jgi:hypothetical protein
VWDVAKDQRQVRYQNLGGPYINRWSIEENGVESSVLFFGEGQLIHAERGQVRFRPVAENPAVFTTIPPRNHDEWVHLGSLLTQHQAAFRGDDLAAMFDQFGGVVQVVPSARIWGVRLTEQGLRLAIRLDEPGPADVPWLASLPVGSYTVEYRPETGYVARPLTPPDLELSPVTPVLFSGIDVSALQAIPLAVTVQNHGAEDAKSVVVSLSAHLPGQTDQIIGSETIDVIAGGSAEARVVWVPLDGGPWIVQAQVEDGVQSPRSELFVADAPSTELHSLLDAQSPGGLVQSVAVSSLSVAVIFAGLLGILLSRSFGAHRTLAAGEDARRS